MPTRTGEGRAERVVYHTDRASTKEEMLARLYQIARTATPSPLTVPVDVVVTLTGPSAVRSPYE